MGTTLTAAIESIDLALYDASALHRANWTYNDSSQQQLQAHAVDLSHQIEIILHEVFFEPLHRKRAPAHALNELVMNELLPDPLHIRAIQDILKEPPAKYHRGQQLITNMDIQRGITYGAKGMV